jgi:glutaredoxin
MKHKINLLILVLFTVLGYAQKKDIEITTNQNDKGVIFNAVNNSNVQQEVTLILTIENLTGYKAPITKLVPPNSTVEMVKLFFVKNKKWNYSSNYSYKPSMSKSEVIANKKKQDEKAKADALAYNKKIKQKTTNDVGDYKKGIVVFSKDGCPRCHYTTSYMLDNNIDFRMINTTIDDKQSKLMLDILRMENPNISTFTFPVVIIDGKVSYSIDDLKGFVSKIKN